MKTRFLYIGLCIMALVYSACKKHDYAEGSPSPIMALKDVRGLYKGTDVTLSPENMLGATKVIGVVISRPDSGNVPSGIVVLQSSRSTKISGIILPLGAASVNYKYGDSLVVNVEGSVLKRVDGALQLTGLSESSITKVSSNNKVTPRQVSSLSIKNNPDLYESTLVQIKSATISPTPKFGDKLGGDRLLVNGADNITMHTEATASFANDTLPASATVAGILFVKQDANGATLLQVWPRVYSDITDKQAPPDPNAAKLEKGAVIVTGFINDTKGGDGNYEYFQFMATRTIDFSKTPASVVTCTNGGTAAPNAGDAPGGGWATGGGRTYKFNLTSGIVNKGEFFYVGGTTKKINGPNTTDISSAKWIRTITYTTNDGDGFGAASSGLLPNSGNAGGIAIFEGTNVVETSVPLDFVIFGGTGKTTIYNSTTNKGYRVVDNDHYSTTDPATGAAQPFVFQGTNIYVIPHQAVADQGNFYKLGGVFNSTTKTWTTPRGYKIYTLTATSTLQEIETGADITVVQ